MHALPVAAPGISPYLAAGISGGVSGAVASGTPEGALMGMVTATSFAGIGHALPMKGLSPAGQTVAKAGLKGLVSGSLSAASGGKFQAGFLSASFSALAAPHVEGVVGEGYAANLIGQGLVGGLASELGGGKFANGFHTGAFNYMFNDMAECQTLGNCTSFEDQRRDAVQSLGDEMVVGAAVVAAPWMRPIAAFYRTIFGRPMVGSQLEISFGRNPNQVHHTFRHLRNERYDVDTAQRLIRDDISQSFRQLPPKTTGTGWVTLRGSRIQYRVYRFEDGSFNVGSIRPPR